MAPIDPLRVGKDFPSGRNLNRIPTAENTLQLIIGLGGTGCDMLRETKGLIEQTCCDDTDPLVSAKRVVYLGIDTDTTESSPLKTAWKCSDGTSITLNSSGFNSEVLELRIPNAGAGLPPAVLATHYPHILKWLDPDLSENPVHGHSGTGGIRQAGRLALFLSMEQLLSKIQAVLASAHAASPITKVNIFLLTGLAGGTGGAVFLDMAYILRQQVAHILHLPDGVTVFGYLAMPDVTAERGGLAWDYAPHNGYAALKELDYLTSLPKVGDRFIQTYIPGSFEIDTNHPPFDHVHLLSHRSIKEPKSGDFYSRVMATAARNILSFVVRPPAGWSSMVSELYDSLSHAVCGTDPALLPYPERTYDYRAIGSAEFALPLDDICKYATTLVVSDVSKLFGNEPTEADVASIAEMLSLTEDSLLAAVAADIQDPITPADNKRAVFHPDNLQRLRMMYDDALGSVKQHIDRQMALFEKGLPDRMKELMDFCLTDPARGPVWVNHLLNRLEHYLVEAQMKLPALASKLRDQISEEKNFRNEMYGRFPLKRDAKAFIESWNYQFQCEVHRIILFYLYQDYSEAMLSTVSKALHCIRELNSRYYDVFTETLAQLSRAAASNTKDMTCTDKKTAGHFEWHDISLGQIGQMAETKHQLLDSNHLIREFLEELLRHIDAGSVNVGEFLENYITRNMQSILNASMDAYLEELYVRNGLFPDLFDALAEPGGLFDWLKDRARPQLLIRPDHKCVTRYLLSIPYNSPKIVKAANAYCATHHDVCFQPSCIGSRITMQSVSGMIPLYAYTELDWYESIFYQANPTSHTGRHLRSGSEDWFELPSPVPNRMRGNGAEASPEYVNALETQRRKLFRDLVRTTAISLTESKYDENDLDCILTVHETLFHGGAVTARVIPVLRHCWRLADPALRLKASEASAAGNPEAYKALRRTGCLRIAEEFFIASLPLCRLGKTELKRNKPDT